MLVVQFEGAELAGLFDKDEYTNQDPYLVFFLDGRPLFTTSTKTKAKKAKWDFKEHRDVKEVGSKTLISRPHKDAPPTLTINPRDLQRTFSAEVFDADAFTGTESMGKCEVTLGDLVRNAFGDERVVRGERLWHRKAAVGALTLRFHIGQAQYIDHLLAAQQPSLLFEMAAQFAHTLSPSSPMRFILCDERKLGAFLKLACLQEVNVEDRVYAVKAVRLGLECFRDEDASKIFGCLVDRSGYLFRQLDTLRTRPPCPSYEKQLVMIECMQHSVGAMRVLRPKIELPRSLVEGRAMLRDMLPKFIDHFAEQREALLVQTANHKDLDASIRHRAYASFLTHAVTGLAWFVRLCLFCNACDAQCGPDRVANILQARARDVTALTTFARDLAGRARKQGAVDARTEHEVETVTALFERLW